MAIAIRGWSIRGRMRHRQIRRGPIEFIDIIHNLYLKWVGPRERETFGSAPNILELSMEVVLILFEG